MQGSRLFLCLVGLLWCMPGVAEESEGPETVQALWADFDPRGEALDSEVVREWEEDGIVYRCITYHIGYFRGEASRMAAFYGFPRGARGLPGLLHLHGGGQRAFLHEVEFYARRGYACLSINWGGREMERAHGGDANTDWGAVDPTQQNVPGYFNLQPGNRTVDSTESPRNNNWYLLTIGARRGLTFLEQQPEVDSDRLGVYGHSMGGSLTVYVAGTDSRVRAAAPSVGGTGFRTVPWPMLPQVTLETPQGDTELFSRTLGFESYAPRISAPLLWLGATNDFHGIMDDTYRTGALIPHPDVRYVFTPHMNHRFTPECAVTRPLWFDRHLKSQGAFPETPMTQLELATNDHVPELRVTPEALEGLEDVEVYYGVDSDPRARFFQSAETQRDGDTWTARLPVLDIRQPLFAFANIRYRVPVTAAGPQTHTTEHMVVSSLLHTAVPEDLQRAGARATDVPDAVLDDFRRGWRDWYVLEAGNPHHWEYSTRKPGHPKWRGQPGQRLALSVQTEQPNVLVMVLTENVFRSYRGRTREYIAELQLGGGSVTEILRLPLESFRTTDGEPLRSWESVDLLSLRAYFDKDGRTYGSRTWAGPQPVLQKLWWQSDAAP